jgi:PIN domain nuclease of toxin-antitoxin system
VIILDTHVWIWWASDPKKLTSAQRDLLENTQEALSVSVVSCWEIAAAVSKGRLTLSEPPEKWFEASLSANNLALVVLTPTICAKAYDLPSEMHADPADRLIVSTTICHNATLITSDAKILACSFVRTVK